MNKNDVHSKILIIKAIIEMAAIVIVVVIVMNIVVVVESGKCE